jgi:hypothetical protein
MFKKILPVLTSSRQHRIPKWETLLQNLATKHYEHVDRYLFLEPNITAPPILFITRMIVALADVIEPILKVDSKEAYFYLMQPRIQAELDRYIDPIRSIETYRSLFIHTTRRSTSSAELIVPVLIKSPLHHLPVLDDSVTWTDIPAIHIWYHDCSLYPTHEGADFLVPRAQTMFSANGDSYPSFTLITMDMTILIMKLLSYLQRYQWNHPLDYKEHLATFVRDELLFRLDEDLKRIWIMQLTKDLLYCTNISMVDDIVAKHKTSRAFNIEMRTPCYAMYQYLADIKSRKLPIESFFNSKLQYGNSSLIDWIEYADIWINCYQLRQYKHIDISLLLPWLVMTVDVLKYSDSKGKLSIIKFEIEKLVNSWLNNKIQNQYKTYELEYWLLQQLDYITKTLETFK